MHVVNVQSEAEHFYHKCLVIDASVLAKVFLAEDDELVRALLSMHRQKNMTIFVPPLLIYEVLNVVTKKTSDIKAAKRVFGLLNRFGLAIMDPGSPHYMRAIADAVIHPTLSFYDSVYCALAKDFGCSLLTADKKLYNCMKSKYDILLLTS